MLETLEARRKRVSFSSRLQRLQREITAGGIINYERLIMETTGLHHFNITAPYEMLERVRDFYVEALGLTVGERPDFRRKGFWLYSRGEPLVHLTACDDGDARANGEIGPNFFDHIAFACRGLAGCIARLKQLEIDYEVVEITSLRQTQVFVRDPSGVGVELNFVNEP
ncbi:MAG TPA: VOC family protein [Pyrinomonadaceae bacterium]|nr:VOC family protein [Pyrinomonadaceae bacterium]